MYRLLLFSAVLVTLYTHSVKFSSALGVVTLAVKLS